MSNTIKVFPTLDCKFKGFDQLFRNYQPEDVADGWLARHSPALATMFLAWYARYAEVVLEGDNLSIFGLLRYNLSTDEASFDHVSAMFKAGFDDQILTSFNWDIFKLSAGVAVQGALFGCALLGAGACLVRFYRRFRQLKRNKDMQVLKYVADVNRIEGAPPKVSCVPKQKGDKQPIVKVQSRMCKLCQMRVCSIIYLPCRHCIICDDCYRKDADKYKCAECSKNVQ